MQSNFSILLMFWLSLTVHKFTSNMMQYLSLQLIDMSNTIFRMGFKCAGSCCKWRWIISVYIGCPKEHKVLVQHQNFYPCKGYSKINCKLISCGFLSWLSFSGFLKATFLILQLQVYLLKPGSSSLQYFEKLVNILEQLVYTHFNAPGMPFQSSQISSCLLVSIL